MVACIYLLLACACIALARLPGTLAVVWLPSAFVLGWMLHRPPRHAPAYLLAAFFARATASLLLGDPPLQALALAASNAVGTAAAWYLLHRLGWTRLGLRDLGPSLRVLGGGVLVAPLLGGAAAALSALLVPTLSPWPTFTTWTAANVYGALALLPPMLAWRPGAAAELARRGVPFAILLPASLLATAAAVEWLEYPFIVSTLPLLLGAFLLRPFALTLLTAANALLLEALRLSEATGAIAQGLDDASRLPVQAFTLLAGITVLPPLLAGIANAERARALRQLALVADNVPALIARLDGDGRFSYVNGMFERWFGRPRSAYAGRDLEELAADRPLPPGLLPRLQDALHGERVHGQVRSRDRTLELALVPELHGGEVVGVFALATDVSELMALQEQLFSEKELAQVTLSSIGDAVVTTDVETCVRFMNPIAVEMTGWPLEEAQGRPFDEVVRLVDSETGEPAWSPMRSAIRDNRPLGLAANTSLQRRDGRRIPVEDAATPIHDREGRVIGGVMVFRDVSETRAIAVKMSHLAQHDHLTELPNRVLLLDRTGQALTRAERQGTGVALLLLGVDRFKHVNDSLGHDAGDALLREMARRLRSAVPYHATVSRLGGDEFAVLLPEVREVRDVIAVSEMLLGLGQMPFRAGGHDLQISLSIGVALFPEDGADATALLRHADAALEEAKQHGRNRYRFFTAALRDRVAARTLLETRLRRDVRDRSLLLHYQSKVDRSGAVCGLEALVRWCDEDGEVHLPGAFIPIAEEIGLVAAIDGWVAAEAVRQLAEWRGAGLPLVPVAVNLSAASMAGNAYVDVLAAALAQHDVPATLLEVEITESQLAADHERSQRVVDALNRLGVRVAVDDFGTGYSSLAYLVRFDFQVLKIDRSFVHELRRGSRQAAVVRAITELARNLGYRVVAEGVETDDQALLARELGCDELQGFLYSQPAPAAIAAEWLGSAVSSSG